MPSRSSPELPHGEGGTVGIVIGGAMAYECAGAGEAGPLVGVAVGVTTGCDELDIGAGAGGRVQPVSATESAAHRAAA